MSSFYFWERKGRRMRSEHTKDMQAQELETLQRSIEEMDDEQLAQFRNSFDPDTMGFSGAEGEVAEK